MIGDAALGQLPLGATASTLGMSWFMPLSEPVRIKRGLAPHEHQAFAAPPAVVVPFSWFQELSQPVRKKPGLPASLQQSFAQDTTPIPVSKINWFMPLSEPVRKKPGLPPHLDPAFAADTEVIPVALKTGWYQPLSEPVRTKQGLKPGEQQAFAGPPRLLPTPNITGTMAAFENFDSFLAGARIWDRIASGEAGLVAQAPAPGTAVIVQQGQDGNASVVVDSSPPTSAGASVTPIFRASVSIRVKT